MKLVKKTAFFSLLASLLLTCGFAEVFTLKFCWDEAPFHHINDDKKIFFNGHYETYNSCDEKVDCGTFSATSHAKAGNDYCDPYEFNANMDFFLYHDAIQKVLQIQLKRHKKDGYLESHYKDGQDLYHCWDNSKYDCLDICCEEEGTHYTLTVDVQKEINDN